MCQIPRGTNGAGLIQQPGRHIIWQGIHSQYALPDDSRASILKQVIPAYAVRVYCKGRLDQRLMVDQ